MLSLGVHWRPPYDTVTRTHFKRLSFIIHIFLHNLERIMKIVTGSKIWGGGGGNYDSNTLRQF
jgi:hypothetical protein